MTINDKISNLDTKQKLHQEKTANYTQQLPYPLLFTHNKKDPFSEIIAWPYTPKTRNKRQISTETETKEFFLFLQTKKNYAMTTQE